MVEVNESASTDSGEVISIGQKLAQARVAQNLSVEQVARYLRLSETVIKALESDTATAEIPATYIRGYVRAYAKLLNIEIDNQTPIATPTPSTRDAGIVGIQNLQSLPQSHTRSRAFSAKSMVISFFIIALAAGGFVWWKSGFVLPKFAVDSAPTSTAAPVEKIDVTAVRGEVALALPADVTAATDMPAADLSAQEAAIENKETVAVSTNKTDAAPASVSKAPVKNETVKDSEKTEKNITVDVARGGETLEFVFVEDCWVRVIDGNGDVLAVGTKRTGVRFVVAGPAPLTVDLGNPVGVQMKHNNRNYDLSAYPGGRPAHLTIQATKFE